jgi:hypothetical protein
MFRLSTSARAAALLATLCLSSTNAWAQQALVATPPPNLVIGNYNSASVGPYGGLEGTAYVARIDDPSAAWFNPAGLVRQASAQISGSAGVYQHTLVAPSALQSEGGSIQQLPNFVGFTFVPRERYTVGVALLSTNTWVQETDAELISPSARLAYSADSRYGLRIAAFGIGYQRSASLRVGAGFAFSFMDLRLVQSASDRIADATGLRSLLVSARASGSALQLRAQGGVQYDAGRWRFGGAIRSPGLTIYRSGSVFLDGVYSDGTGSSGASLFDDDAQLEYHLPWEFQGGAALVGPRAELEISLQAYTPVNAYPLLSSEQQLLQYVDEGGNAPPIVTAHPLDGFTSASRGIVNVSAGGHVRLLQNRDLRLHVGIGSNQSQVAPGDEVFTAVDLLTWSVGVSGSLGNFRFSVGMNRQSGTDEDVMLRNPVNGEPVHSPVDVVMVGFIYSLSYQF